MIESILKSSLKRKAKGLKAEKISDVSLALVVVNDRFKPEFIVLHNGVIQVFVTDEKKTIDFTPASKILGMMDYIKYDTLDGDKVLARNLKKICEKEEIANYKDLYISISYIEKGDEILLYLWVDNQPIRELEVDDLIGN